MYICMFLLHSNHQMEYVVHVQNRRNRLCKGAIAHPHIWVGKEAKPSPSNEFGLQLAPPPPWVSDLPTALSHCNCSETNTSS